MTGRRAGSVAVAAVVVAALLVVALAAWASTSGPSGVFTDEGFEPAATPSQEQSAPEPDDPASPFDEDDTPADVSTQADWARVVGLVLQVTVSLVAAYLLLRYAGLPLLRWLRDRLSRRRKEREAQAEADRFAVLDPPEAVAREMATDAPVQRQLLVDTDSPRNAVVACWHRFEAQAEAAGVGRRPSETSSEYTMRVLDLVDAHQPAVSRLAALYREARFSEHDLTEQHRADALAALDEIHRTTGIPA